MKYYLMCNKLLGPKPFDELVKSLTSQIIARFSSNILLDKYMEVLEYNIKVIMLIALYNSLKLTKEEMNSKIDFKEFEGKLIIENFLEFEEKNKKYINKIINLLSE